MSMRKRLTVVLIAKNEEDKLEKCLQSVAWADEFVVVDDMSSDRTVAIAESLGAKVIQNESNGNFDNQRNLGIEAASGEWIMQMDADEIVPKDLKEEIISMIENPSGKVAYKYRRKNYFLGHFMRYGGWFNEYSTKLFMKDKARYTGMSVHETLSVTGETGVIEACIEHYPFTSVSQFIERQNFYTSVEARVMLEEKGTLSEKEIMYHIKVRPRKLFWKLYVKKQGFREGYHGLVFSVLFTWVYYTRWIKYWELLNKDQMI